MNTKASGCTLLVLTIFAGLARAAEPGALHPPVPVVAQSPDGATMAGATDQPQQPDKLKAPDKKLTEPPKTDLFAQTPAQNGDSPASFNPHMMGDFPGTFVRQQYTVLGFQTITTTTIDRETNATTVNRVTVPTSASRIVVLPASFAGAFKIAENESPKPQDRVFVSYNFYGNLRGPQNGPNDAFTSSQTTINANTLSLFSASTSAIFIPATPRVNVNLHRETFGFEKTFLDGFASIEMRVPLLQQRSSVTGIGASDIGDLTIIGKYAFLLDEAGNVLSAGLAVTAPTGPSIATIDGNLHSTLLQPWAGYIWNFDRFYLQAFHSVVIPTDARDVTLLFNDVGFNFWLYRGSPNRFLQFIVPTVEAHVTTPLNHRDLNGAIFAPDLVVLTGGAHLGLFGNATLTLGAATPVTGPRPCTVEGFAQLNWRW
jgi:hypothetical protein